MIAPKDFQHTLYSVRDHVAEITLNRPERRNALNPRAYAEIEGAFRAAQDPEVRCVIVTGADPAFCSGEDVKEMMTGERPVDPVPKTKTVRHPPTPAAMAALECDRPVIAAVNGPAIGWGMELALYADIRIASHKASFSEMFIKRGLIADVGAFYRLPALVGYEKAAELLFTGDLVPADEAKAIGLVSRVVAHEKLMDEAHTLASRIAANAPLALRYMKDGLRRWSFGDPREIGSWTIETLRELFETEDHREGVASFLEKRAPRFKGC